MNKIIKHDDNEKKEILNNAEINVVSINGEKIGEIIDFSISLCGTIEEMEDLENE